MVTEDQSNQRCLHIIAGITVDWQPEGILWRKREVSIFPTIFAFSAIANAQAITVTMYFE